MATPRKQRKQHRVLSVPEREAIIAACRAGEKMEAIAAEHDVSVSCVSGIAKRAGLPPRVRRAELFLIV